MQSIDPSATVASLVLRSPSVARTFERFGIDFCCRGHMTLQEACREKDLTVLEVLADLEHELNQPGPPEAPSEACALIDHIVERHHSFAREELARLLPLAAKVERAHGQRHPELHEVNALVQDIASELLPHMAMEEQELFPLLRKLAQGSLDLSLGSTLAVLQHAHEDLGRQLSRLRALTSDFAPPSDSCTSYRVLYRGLEQLTADLHQHVHLENNVLFPDVGKRWTQPLMQESIG